MWHVSRVWWPLALALAVAVALPVAAAAQPMPLAERLKQCGTCQGEDGNSRLERIPSLAGQPALFVMNQLFLMREGVRQIDAMAPLVKDLTDADLQAIAAHYAALPPRPSGESVDPALAARGAGLAARLRCGSCHLPTFAGQEQMPRLARQRIDYMIYAMNAYRTDTRSGADTLMSATLVGLRDDDIVALAHYVASK